MKTYHVVTYHAGDMAFETHIGHHKIFMDRSGNESEDKGPSPKRLLLGTLAACTGMDVVLLLTKMRVAFSDFEIVTNAELTAEHPQVYSRVEIIYKIRVDEVNRKKVEKSVHLSQERYCGVSAMLRKNNPLETKIEYL